MPGRRIFESASAPRRLAEAEAWLLPRAHEGEVLVVGAHREGLDHFVRTLALRHGALFGVRRHTLNELAYRLALPRLTEKGLAPQSRLADEALASRLVHASRGSLGELDALAKRPGFPRALARTLAELRLFRVPPGRLANASAWGPALALLLEKFDEEARLSRVADRSIVLTLAIEAALEGPAPVGLPTLLLDVSVGNPLEAELVGAVTRKTNAVLATLPRGDPSLTRLETALGVSAERDPSARLSSSLARAQQFLFSSDSPALIHGVGPHPHAGWAHGCQPPGEGIVFLSAPGEVQEAVELARAVQAEAAEGVRFDEMAILLCAPGLYTPLVEEALDRAGVPFYFETGTERPDPAGRAFLALLHCASERLSATRFAEYVSLGQVPDKPDSAYKEDTERAWAPARHELAPPSPTAAPSAPMQLELFAEPDKAPVLSGTLRGPWRWEQLLVDAAVIGGKDRWERRLSGLSEELRARLLEIEDPDSPAALSLRRRSEDLEHLRAFALPLIERLASLPARAPWGAWLDALSALASQALSQPEGVLSVIQELRPMSAVGDLDVLEVTDVLSERLTLLSQPPPAYRYGRVWVAPLDAVRGLAFDVVLVPGLAERVFPRKILEDPLLLDAARKRLDVGLPLQEDRIAKERLLLRLALGAARRKVVLSYPAADLQKARARVPSFYLLEVARASEGRLPDFEEIQRRAAVARGARLGWPAARDPRRAIDASEHDLAVLADALRPERSSEGIGALSPPAVGGGAPTTNSRGVARYLLDVNPGLARSLRARYRRCEQTRFTSADGLAEASADARRALERHRLGARSYSVTTLEQFAGCPYRFFLQAVQGLRPRDTVESITHLDPLTRGHVLHAAQFQILRVLQDEGLLPIRPERLDRVLDVTDRVFDRLATEFEENLAPAIARIWQDEMLRTRNDLHGWLRRESVAGSDWVPHRFEFTFGMRPRGPADPASVLTEARLQGGLRLRGAIDLVERRPDGRFRVTDYKSGKALVPESAIVSGGRSLQRVLYALAYEALTGVEVVEGRLYYSTARGGYAERRIPIDEEALKVVEGFQTLLEGSIEEAFFPAFPFPTEGCQFCDYRAVCGPRAERLAEGKRNDSDRALSRLSWLRTLT